MMRRTSTKHQIGATLIEILVATFISSIGVLGLSKLQVNSLFNNQQTQYSSLVTWQLLTMAEKMRANSVAAAAGDYLDAAADNDCITASCSTTQMAASDIFNWNLENADLFPSGVGTITQPGGAGTAFVITVRWDGNRNGATGTDCSAANLADLLCSAITLDI